MLKKIAVITDIPFWRHIAGHMARLTSLINYLHSRLQVVIIYGGGFNNTERECFLKEYNDIKLITFNTSEHGLANFAYFIKKYFAKHKFDACIRKARQPDHIWPV